jgi:hypothetical protein
MMDMPLPEPMGILHDANGNNPLTFEPWPPDPERDLVCSTMQVFGADQVRDIVAAEVAKERERLIPERDAIGELLCNVADNLGDLPISEAWADAVSKRASKLLMRNDYFRSAAIQKDK